jgi:hypothetical protein
LIKIIKFREGGYAGNPARYIKSIGDYLEGIKKNSLGLGHLKRKEKDDALKKYSNYAEHAN